MIKRKNELENDIRENMRGGNGKVEIIKITDDKYQNDKCRLFAKIILPKGSSIGFHEHEGEFETFYIIKGQAIAADEDKKEILYPGDCMFTGFGKGHSLKNEQSEDLELMALILID